MQGGGSMLTMLAPAWSECQLSGPISTWHFLIEVRSFLSAFVNTPLAGQANSPGRRASNTQCARATQLSAGMPR